MKSGGTGCVGSVTAYRGRRASSLSGGQGPPQEPGSLLLLPLVLGPLLVQLPFRIDQPFFRSAMLLDMKPSGRNPNEMTLQEEAAFV